MSYIDQQAAIDLFYPVDPENDGSDGCTVVYRPGKYSSDEIEAMLSDLTAADVAPVIRGSWNLLRHDRHSDVFRCSECGRKVSLTHGRDVLEQFPYCHCGAKMSAEGGSI